MYGLAHQRRRFVKAPKGVHYGTPVAQLMKIIAAESQLCFVPASANPPAQAVPLACTRLLFDPEPVGWMSMPKRPTNFLAHQFRSIFTAPWTREALKEVPPEKLLEAYTQTGQRVTQLLITLFGVVSFCFLSLLASDRSLLGAESTLDVPFAGRVSFLGFMIIGPILLIGLRLYVTFFHQHWKALELALESSSAVRAPTVSLLTDPRLQLFSGFLLYCAVPLLMIGFLWKAAGLPGWGSFFLPPTAAVVGWHLALAIGSSSRLRVLRGIAFVVPVAAALLAVGLYPDSFRRSMRLSRAELAGANLAGFDLRGADLRRANLEHANLGADLSGVETGAPAEQAGIKLGPANLDRAHLAYADLRGADLRGTRFEGATLFHANLRGAILSVTDFIRADLTQVRGQELDFQDSMLWDASLDGADLRGANLMGAMGLTSEQAKTARIDETTRLPF
jgi:hypothetical protein